MPTPTRSRSSSGWTAAPVVVDPGMSTYEPGAERDWFRGTRAHSTVAVDGDQFELWGAFRSGPLPRVELLEASERELAAAVTGRTGVRHERRIRLDSDELTIHDRLEGGGTADRRELLPLAPGADAAAAATGSNARTAGASSGLGALLRAGRRGRARRPRGSGRCRPSSAGECRCPNESGLPSRDARRASCGQTASRFRPLCGSKTSSRRERRLRILLLSQYFAPEVGATQSRMQAFAEHLAARGHEVTVICEFPNHPHGVIPAEYGGHIYEDDRSNPYRILRVWVKASEEKTQRTRMAFYLSYMALATAMAPVAGRADVVVATTPPLFTGDRRPRARAAQPRPVRARRPRPLAVGGGQPDADLTRDERSARPSGWSGCSTAGRPRSWPSRSRFASTWTASAMRQPPTTLIPNGTLEMFLDAQPENGRDALGADDSEFVVTFAGTHRDRPGARHDRATPRRCSTARLASP